MSEKIVQFVQEKLKNFTDHEDVGGEDLHGACSGQIDDAYSLGLEQGYLDCLQDILELAEK